MTIFEEPSDLDSRIVELVRQCWDEHRMPLLLSRLGGEYNGDIAREAKEQAGSLGAYLRQRLADHVRVVQHRTRHTVIGAIPRMSTQLGISTRCWTRHAVMQSRQLDASIPPSGRAFGNPFTSQIGDT